jgi:hypothetical protein
MFPVFSIFHQKEQLTTRIHNILEEYPTGKGNANGEKNFVILFFIF